MHRNTKLIIETIVVFLLTSVTVVYLSSLTIDHRFKLIIYIPLLLFQGLWFYRFYVVGHEAAHKKLFPENIALNDFWGSVILLPLLVPITIYRKIHYFHHGFNRKDEHTAAIDTFVIKGKPTKLKKIYYYSLFYISTFLGGFFIHSLISVILFLFVPPKLSIKISPAFKNWTYKDQLKSIILFLLGCGFHLFVFLFFGKMIYLYTLGYPMLAFAWLLSMFVYALHYDTTIGDSVRYNVRSVKRTPIISWALMDFNEHATHHQHPNIPWYELSKKRQGLPQEFNEKNQKTWNLFIAICNQLKGPAIIYEPED